MDKLEFTAAKEFECVRIDKFLSVMLPELSRAFIQTAIARENVFVNEKPVLKNYKVKAGDAILLLKEPPRALSVEPQNIPLDIRYEDNDLLVVNKAKGMVVHPAPGNYDQTLVNALLYHCGESLSGINGVLRPGIIHRIDKDTSGLLIVAKNDTAHRALAEQIKVHSFKREYQAVIVGHLKQSAGIVDAPIGRNPNDRKKMTVTEKNSKQAITHYEVLTEYKGFSHVRLRLETGRTHQIRVHMAYLGHPLAGDTVYGSSKQLLQLGGQCLHAGLIGFIHPTTGKYIELCSELPKYFTDFLEELTLE